MCFTNSHRQQTTFSLTIFAIPLLRMSPAAYITKATNGSDLPAFDSDKPHTYHAKHITLRLVFYFLSQCGAFFGCFFGIRGPNNEWPHAWWSFALLANAFIFTWNYSYSISAKIIRHPESVEHVNFWGRSLYNAPLEKYERIGLYNGLCCNIVYVKTDAYVEELKARYRWCGWCICKCSKYSIHEIDQFKRDHGLSGDLDTAEEKV